MVLLDCDQFQRKALPLGHNLNLTLLTVHLKILTTPYNPYYLVGVFCTKVVPHRLILLSIFVQNIKQFTL